jgi:predicted extracellular nuclease
LTIHRHKRSTRTASVGVIVAAAVATGLVALPRPAVAAEVHIHDLQGATRLSPYAGKTVSAISGIVTGVRSFGSRKGFWIQDTAPDRDPATSEGIFVLTGSDAPTVAAGDSVRVSGTVTEFYPGRTPDSDDGGQSVTQISTPTVTVVSSGNPVPAPVVIRGRTVPHAYVPAGNPAAKHSIEGLPLRPRKYALDFYESIEGENVQVKDVRVVGPSAHFSLWVTTRPTEHPTARGGTLYSSYTAPNPGRLQVQSLIPNATRPFPRADVGDVLTGTTEGPLDFNEFGGYVLAARTLGAVRSNGLRPESTRRQRTDELAVATYNVENLAPGDSAAKYARLGAAIVTRLATPDIVALEEIQDNSGARDDGTVASDQTVRKFTDAIAAAGGPAYESRSIDPVNDQDGGAPGGNIRQVLLFNPARVSFTDRPGATATSAVGVRKAGGRASLTLSPGRIAPTDMAWRTSRKPLAAEFSFRGKPVFVVANHFNSKGGDFPLTSRYQPVPRVSEVQRVKQATLVNGFVKRIQAVQKDAAVVVLGDINDYEFSAAGKALTAGGALKDLYFTLKPNERYSYVFQGNSQVLDHILVSRAVTGADYDVVHINAEFTDQASDHDPQVVRIKP